MGTQVSSTGIRVTMPDGLTLRSTDLDALGRGFVEDEPVADEWRWLWKAVTDDTDVDKRRSEVLEIGGELSEGAYGFDGTDGLLDEAEGPSDVVPVTFVVPLEEGQTAIILEQDDGVFRWRFPSSVGDVSDDEGGAFGAFDGTPRRAATFDAPIKPSRDKSDGDRGFVDEWILRPVKRFVVRLFARRAGELLTDYLEKGVVETPFLIEGDSLDAWKPCPNLGDIALPESGVRVLLLVHGTFSSTIGSFGGLTTTDSGHRFLQLACQQYDAVIAYDHRTLSKSIAENAGDLRLHLRALQGSGPITLDAIAFSRGGLVLRHLIDVLLPSFDREVNVRRAVFVGCTNAGTLLAEPDNWETLVDLYTNVVVGASKLIGYLGGPAVKVASDIVSGALTGILSFAKALVDEAIENEIVPGLASMEPDGRDVGLLRARQHGQPSPDDVDFFAVTSNFNHKLFGDTSAEKTGLARRFLFEAADRAVDRLMREANDLVVNKRSMTEFDTWVEGWVTDQHNFAETDGVYHTVYFQQEIVASKLQSWLLD